MSRGGPIRVTLSSLLYPPLYSGAARQARAVLARMEDRIEVTVWTLGRRDLEREERDERGWRIRRWDHLERPGYGRRFAGHVLRALARGPKPDVLFGLGVDPSTYGALALAHLRGIPTVVKLTLEGEDDPVTLSHRSFGRQRLALLRTADAVVCPSRRLAELAREAGLSPSRIHHIPNGVDLDRFRPPVTGTRNPHALVWVGAIQARKRPDLALAAALPLFPRFPGLEFHVVGGLGRTPEARRFGEEFIASVPEEVRSRVIFHGSTDRPEDAVARAGVLLFPSEAEGLPNVVLEAMACGTIPVVSDLPALHEAVDAEVGRFVDRNETADWTRAIEEILTADESLDEMRLACRRRAEQRFDLGGTSASYEAIFRRLAARESDTSADEAGPTRPGGRGQEAAGPGAKGERA